MSGSRVAPRSRRQVRRFVGWLCQNAEELSVPGQPSGTPRAAMADNERLRVLRRLLDGGTMDARLRVAGCLVLLYAQPVARIVRLTAADAELGNDAARIRLGRDSVMLPPPLGGALAAMLERAGADHPNHWLFTGLKAGQPTHPGHLAARLSRSAFRSAPGAAAHWRRLPTACPRRSLPICSDSAQRRPPGRAPS